MTTQYTSILKLALPVQGELSGTWGDVVNDNITSMVEQAIAGRAVINSWSSNSHTLTTANGTTSESRCAMLEFTDTGTQLSGAGTVVCPALSKIYIAKNAAGQNVTLKTASGTGILVPNGRTMFLFCDGTNVVEAVTSTTSLQLGTSTTVTAVLDEDNMASNSATSLATQQSIKAYVDAQVGSFDTLAEVLAQGNTTGSTNIEVTSAQKVQFRDSAIYINSSADGQLDLVADTEIQIAATTIDINGAINASGEIIAASLDISGDVDVDGTLETDALSINGTTVTSTAAELNILDGVTATTAELNYVDGVTSNVQTQLDAKSPIASPTFTGTVTIPTADINAGSIDGTAIGASSASTGAFTTLTATGLTVDTNTLYVNSTNNRVGIGTTSPSRQLEIYDDGTNGQAVLALTAQNTENSRIMFADPDDSNIGILDYNHTDDSMRFTVNNSERMRIDSSGNVGIGITSSLEKFTVTNASSGIVGRFTNNTNQTLDLGVISGSGAAGGVYYNSANSGYHAFQVGTTEHMRIDGGGNAIFTKSGGAYLQLKDASAVRGAINVATSDGLVFTTGSSFTERMRIDSSGNLLVGKSSSSLTTAGVELFADGKSFFTRSSANAVVYFNKEDNDGSILEFRKDGSTVGSIGTRASQLSIGSADTGLEFNNANDNILPHNTSTNGGRDAAIDLGASGTRFKNLYLSGNAIVGGTAVMQDFGSGRTTLALKGAGSTDYSTLQLGNYGTSSNGQIHGLVNFYDGTTSVSRIQSIRASNTSDAHLAFYTAPSSGGITERARLDSSGNLLVGKTASSVSTAGHELLDYGRAVHTVNASTVQILNRKSNDGDIAIYQKDGTTVGSIGTVSNDIHIGGLDDNHASLRFAASSKAVLPVKNSDGGLSDNTTDLGASNARFKDLYLSGAANIRTIAAQRGDAGTLIQATSASGNGSGIINFMSSLTSTSNNANCVHYQGTTQNVNSWKLLGNGTSTWSSDINLKRDIETTRDGYLDDIKQLRVVKYKWKNDPDSETELGLIAQEVEDIFPSLVTEDKNSVGDEVLFTEEDEIPTGKTVGDVKVEGSTYKGIKYGVIPLILLKAIQEQQTLIESLTARIAALEE